MRTASVRERVEESLRERSKELTISDLQERSKERLAAFTASFMAEAFSVSRNLISHYLSQMCEEGICVRVNSRPAYFFVKEQLEHSFSCVLSHPVYESLEQLALSLTADKEEQAFRELIGANGSLSYCVEQCKAAMSYPGNGLPILLYGPTGTGKSLLAGCMYRFAMEKGKLPEHARFVTVNCAEYANNPEFLLTNLFGYKKGAYTGADADKEGLIALAQDGVLFLDEVHALKPECQEKIFLFMDKGIYHMVGDNETWHHGNVHMIFATTEDPKVHLLKTLLRRIPITVILPSLKQRPLQEKRELIRFLFQQEAASVHASIYLSRMAYQVLETTNYNGNVGELKNHVRAASAKALLNQKQDDRLDIHIYDLPSQLLEHPAMELGSCDDETMMDVCHPSLSSANSRLYQFSCFLMHSFLQQERKGASLSSFAYSMHDKVEQYIDYLCSSEEEHSFSAQGYIVSLMGHIFSIIAQKYHLHKVSNHEVVVLSRFIADFLAQPHCANHFAGEHGAEMDRLLEGAREQYPIDYNVAVDTSVLVEDALHLHMGRIGQIWIFLLFHYFDRDLKTSAIPGVIIAHGYSIASSIAEIANQLLDRHVFDAIDMPIESDFNMVLSRLKSYLQRREDCHEYIVMVDMGSLEDIYTHLESFRDTDIGIINNVSTKLAVDIGSMILEGEGIGSILQEASERNSYRFKVIRNRRKQSVILTVCETGIGTAEKIADLIESSLPLDTGIRIIPYDYTSLAQQGTSCIAFEKYRILGIVGTKDPMIEDTPFVSIEELLEQKNIERILTIFQKELDNAQIKQLNENIIKNFSIRNLLDYLTILDTEKIIDHVHTIINCITEGLHMQLESGVVMGLYVHISCLIERLIISRHVVRYEKIDAFLSEHADFVALVKTAFAQVEKIYNVDIPIDEIAYIYEYIYNRRGASVNEEKDSVKEFEYL